MSHFRRRSERAAFAPARVNLIGEHTDYNGGLVLPMALSLGTTAELAHRADGMVHAFSTSLPAGDAERSYRRGEETRTGTWIDYVQGVTHALHERGHVVPGFDLAIDSDVPLGGGLASSASLEISVLRAIRDAFGLQIDDLELALTAHRAETNFVGAPVGLMDQMVASLAQPGEALLIDTRTLATERVTMPDGVAVAVIDSGLRHGHATGDYRIRRQECEQAAALLGVALLSELDEADLPRIASLRAPLDRRARHVITENGRVRAAVRAMRTGASADLGRLWTASHASMRDDFDVSLPDIDALVEIALEQPGVIGARLTGGGFGGAVIVLADRASADEAAAGIQSRYRARTRQPGRTVVVTVTAPDAITGL